MKTVKSELFLNRLGEVVPGGASSNARCGGPIAVARGKGAELFDMDGNRYIDYVLGFGPILLGHADAYVSEAVSEAMDVGTTFALSHEKELGVAQQIVATCPSVDMVRLCNSGTDAATTAYRIACAKTGASIAVKIEGDYHGNVDILLHDIPGVSPSGNRRRPIAACSGISQGTTELVRTVAFNRPDALEDVLKRNRGNVAAVFMEPILGNTAAIMPKPGYLESVRQLCDDQNVLLVFDEVKTGFRVALGGAQALLGVESDLTLFGKALANGLPLAAIGGRREYMELVRPAGVHHCGTYFGNLPCTAAADAVLHRLAAADYEALLLRGERLAVGICGLLAKANIPAHWHGVGTMFGISIGSEKPYDYESWWERSDRELWVRITKELLRLGVLSDGFIGLFFLSFSHTDDHVDATLAACEEAILRSKRS